MTPRERRKAKKALKDRKWHSKRHAQEGRRRKRTLTTGQQKEYWSTAELQQQIGDCVIEQQLATTVRDWLEQNKEDFESDPEDDSFWVHRRLTEAARTLALQHGRENSNPFSTLTENYEMVIMMMQVGDQQEILPYNLPGVRAYYFIKGAGICICGLNPILLWLEESESVTQEAINQHVQQLNVAQIAEHYRLGNATPPSPTSEDAVHGFMLLVNQESGQNVMPLFNIPFVLGHPIAKCACANLIRIFGQIVSNAKNKNISGAVYPVEIADDATMTVETNTGKDASFCLKEMRPDMMTSWGPTRAGVAVTLYSKSPTRWQVFIGPFFELQDMLRSASTV